MIETNERLVSYSLGWQFGRHLMTHNFEGLDLEHAFEAARDCFFGRKSPYTDEQAELAYRAVKTKVDQVRQQEAAKLAPLSQAFLEDNASKEGVQVTDSGLQLEIIERGDGPVPSPIDVVRVNYHGTLFNGQVFDSSIERGIPAELAIQEVIPGWREALQLIPVGTRCRLWLPPELAYGERGNPPQIPGKVALCFELELLAIC